MDKAPAFRPLRSDTLALGTMSDRRPTPAVGRRTNLRRMRFDFPCARIVPQIRVKGGETLVDQY